ncbi:MAG: hypothetical protein JNK84_19460 [Phreatobacter sp.]|uniref:hypothetical protein n=1 Tax=Phreatobacter sp. TaxID=1966341 RepID=UPI001A43310D|nr:hypothetical protein [Phreatobacter sp.]MBL8571258.1 hypothetical protein [Phreatobacter sp.]
MTTNATSTIKLADTQLVALSSASQRFDRCIVTVELEKGPKDQESRYRITAMSIVAKAA